LINMDVRAAAEAEIEHLARLWHEGWHDAHGQIVPAQLVSLRTVESFAKRLQAALADVRVSGPFGDGAGLCIIKGEELYQLYVAAQARGTGVAAALMADAEARLSQRGVNTAWLACAIGNERAARFYEKCGWHLAGTVSNALEISQGTFPLQVWRYEKLLAGGASAS
jgi:GNAT superfamily N-acetyltransferase